MSNQRIIILEPKTSEQMDLFKSMAKALKLKIEIKEKPYNPDFVEKIMKSKKQITKGKFTDVKAENINSFMDSL